MRTSSEQRGVSENFIWTGRGQWELHLNREGSVGTSSEHGGVSENFI